jgi:hypothetical protein
MTSYALYVRAVQSKLPHNLLTELMPQLKTSEVFSSLIVVVFDYLRGLLDRMYFYPCWMIVNFSNFTKDFGTCIGIY